jgi:hypothetical protein
MSAKPSKPETDSETASAMAETVKVSFWRRLLTSRWVAVFLVLSLVIHGALLICWPAAVRSKSDFAKEIDLGAFRFVNSEHNVRLAKVAFKLHVSLLLGTEKIGGTRLAEKKFLVQQAIEELLRQAHAGDFDDPTLAELKRQMQEKVNEAVEMRIVEEVIITDLEMEERDLPAKSSVASFEQAAEDLRAAKTVPETYEREPDAGPKRSAEPDPEGDPSG